MSQLDLAKRLYNQDRERAIRIAMGDENAPKGIRASAVYTIVCDKAEKTENLDLCIQIANSFHNSKISTDAQKFEYRNPNSAIEKMKEVVNARRAAFEKTLPKGKTIEDAIQEEVKKMKEEIAKTPKDGLSKEELLKLVDEIYEE